MNKGVMIICSIAVVVLAISFSLFLTSGIFLHRAYLEPWQKKYFQQFDDPRIGLAAHGLLAPNGHNMQPWKIKLDKNEYNVFYLFADAERLTKEVDPLGRQLMITQGTFLEYVKIAGKKLGYKTNFIFFPDGEYDELKLNESIRNKPVAKIILTKTKQQNSLIYDFMFKPDTNRAAYQPTSLTSEQIKQLQAITIDSDMNIKLYLDQENKAKLGSYALAGAKVESSIHRIYQETANIFRANEYQKNRYRYGFSVEGQGTSGMIKHLIQGFITLFPAINNEKNSAELFVKGTNTAVNNTAAYAMIITKGNSRIQQIKSGMIYSRLVLAAHALGIVMQPLSQVLEEYPEMVEGYSKIHGEYAPEGRTIQMFLRLGKPTQAFPLSMRRDIMDLIKNN